MRIRKRAKELFVARKAKPSFVTAAMVNVATLLLQLTQHICLAQPASQSTLPEHAHAALMLLVLEMVDGMVYHNRIVQE